MSELRLEIKVKNNLLWGAIHGRYASVSECARDIGVNPGPIYALLSLVESPYGRTGRLRPFAFTLCERLGMNASEIFPPHLYELGRRDIVIETDAPTFLSLGSREGQRALAQLAAPGAPTASNQELADDVVRALKAAAPHLKPKELEVLLMRYSEGLTLQETGARLNVGSERARQIETQALRHLRGHAKDFAALLYEKIGPNDDPLEPCKRLDHGDDS